MWSAGKRVRQSSIDSRYPATSKDGGSSVPSGRTIDWYLGGIVAIASAVIVHAVKSACSVNAMDASPMSKACWHASVPRSPWERRERVAGFRVRVEFLSPGRLFHRDVHPGTGAFVPGIGQERQFPQVGPGLRQDKLAGRGQVTRVLPGSTSETHSGTPRGAARACTFPAG